MHSKFTLIIEELRKQNFPVQSLGANSEMRKIEEQMSKVNLDLVIG